MPTLSLQRCSTERPFDPSVLLSPLWLQNLIILLQLSERTQALAPGFARLLLKLYFWAILPCTLWVTAFATNLGLALR